MLARPRSATSRAILVSVSPAATLVEALEPLRSDPAHAAVLLDIDGTLAPIVRHAADAHVPEATRTLLIEISKRYGVVGCVSGRRAATARQIVAIGRSPTSATTAASCCAPAPRAPELDPELEAWTGRVRDFAAPRLHRRAPAPARAQRGQGGDRRLPLARRARRGGRGGSRAGDRRHAREEEGFAVHWGRKVLEVRPPVRARQGPRRHGAAATPRRGSSIAAALYVGDDTTDLDAFRALRALVAVRRAASRACAWPSAPRRRRRSSARRPTSRSTAPAACAACSRRCCRRVRFVDFLKTTVLLSAGAATALAAVTVLSVRHRSRARCSCRSPSAGGCSRR